MNFNLESLAIMVITALVASGEEKALGILQDFHDKDEKLYKASIFVGDWALGKLENVTDKTVTKIDDTLVKDATSIIAKSAAANGLTL